MGEANRLKLVAIAVAAFAASAFAAPAQADDFFFPVACKPGIDCFIQMLPDIDPGPGTLDPFCGSSTRNGYPGTDIRLRSMADVKRGFDVFALSGGTVVEARDGLADRLVRTAEDMAVVSGIECGNGVAIDHGGGLVSHYCHLRRSSLTVTTGDRIESGEKIGEAGASGLARFPGLHMAVLRDGNVVDPISGTNAGNGCRATTGDRQTYFPAEAIKLAGFGETRFLGSGVAGSVINPDELAITGEPEPVNATSAATIAWGWIINLHRGDRIRLTLFGPAGGVVASKFTRPTSRPEPEFAVFAGRSGSPVPGSYRVVVEVLRKGKPVNISEKSIDIAG